MIVKIFGGHGRVALLLSETLHKRGDSVVGLIRDPAQVKDVEETGAEAKLFDLEHAEQSDFESAIKGADALVWSAGAGGKGGPSRTDAIDHKATVTAIKAAEKVGVSRFVLVSYLGSGPNHPFKPGDALYNYAEAKAKSDVFLEKSSLNWTILGPGLLTFDEPTGKIAFNPPRGSGSVSRSNVALVAAEVLHNDKSIRKHVPFLDGEEPISKVVDSL